MMQRQILESSLDNGKLLRSLGARRGQGKVSAGMQRRIDRWRRRLPELIQPKMVHRMVPLRSAQKGCLHLADGGVFKSPKLARTLREADTVCCFVASIGADLEAEVQRCMARNRFADAYVLDTLGSLVVEALVERFHLTHEEQMRARGRGVTLRFSPGYCDWPVLEQVPLFDRFEQRRPAGIRLTETCLMRPRKSISGVFGIVPRVVDGSVADYNPCRSCAQRNCKARRGSAGT